MTQTADNIAAALRPIAPGNSFTPAELAHINALAAAFDARFRLLAAQG